MFKCGDYVTITKHNKEPYIGAVCVVHTPINDENYYVVFPISPSLQSAVLSKDSIRHARVHEVVKYKKAGLI